MSHFTTPSIQTDFPEVVKELSGMTVTLRSQGVSESKTVSAEEIVEEANKRAKGTGYTFELPRYHAVKPEHGQGIWTATAPSIESVLRSSRYNRILDTRERERQRQGFAGQSYDLDTQKKLWKVGTGDHPGKNNSKTIHECVEWISEAWMNPKVITLNVLMTDLHSSFSIAFDRPMFTPTSSFRAECMLFGGILRKLGSSPTQKQLEDEAKQVVGIETPSSFKHDRWTLTIAQKPLTGWLPSDDDFYQKVVRELNEPSDVDQVDSLVESLQSAREDLLGQRHDGNFTYHASFPYTDGEGFQATTMWKCSVRPTCVPPPDEGLPLCPSTISQQQ